MSLLSLQSGSIFILDYLYAVNIHVFNFKFQAEWQGFSFESAPGMTDLSEAYEWKIWKVLMENMENIKSRPLIIMQEAYSMLIGQPELSHIDYVMNFVLTSSSYNVALLRSLLLRLSLYFSKCL